jgi:methylase of polypeptide subunit release factors
MDRDDALLELLGYLKAREYRFHAVTPATHARVLARPFDGLPTLADIFGWNRSFAEPRIEPELHALMQRANILRPDGDGVKSALRVASLGDDLFLHSAYPTDEADAVFFGPDTYRFARFINDRWPPRVSPRVVDLGAGSGAGGVAAARLAPDAAITLVDVNAQALRLARINALAANVAVELIEAKSSPKADIIIANPPYMMDEGRRSYRDGGDNLLGGALALEWTMDALAKLAPGGTLLLYTGAAFARGISPLLEALKGACASAGAEIALDELDPDVFGEELEQPPYRNVERIAAIGVEIRVPA